MTIMFKRKRDHPAKRAYTLMDSISVGAAAVAVMVLLKQFNL